MGGGLEDVLETTICNKAEREGWLVRKVQWPGRRGAMDHVFAKKGRVVFIEFKAPGKKPNPLQAKEIARWRAAGVEVYWLDNYGDAVHTLKLFTELGCM